jgi:nicotinate-nucleotide adenylyltransferase
MKIGLFFGSFNPVHIGHLLIASFFTEFTDLEKVWFIISPQSPFKENHALVDEAKRLEMLRLAISGDDRFETSDVEFGLTRPSYTVNTLAHLRHAWPGHTFVPIIGGDNLQSFHQWKLYEEILAHHTIYVYRRVGFHENPLLANHSSIRMFDVPLLNISSTYVRELLLAGKSARYLVPEKVRQYISGHKLYSPGS